MKQFIISKQKEENVRITKQLKTVFQKPDDFKSL